MAATPTTQRSRRHAGLVNGVAAWRSGSARGQAWALGVLLVGVGASLAVSLTDYDLMPLTAYFVWLLLGAVLLRFVPMLVLCAGTLAAAITAAVVEAPWTGARVTAAVTMVLAVLLLLFQSSRRRSGLPGGLGEAMLADLRDRLQAQGKVPPLPTGWECPSAMLAAHGAGYAGDFLVADLDDDGRHLEMILVDVCGKGVDAATQALQFAGALGGLIGALPPLALLEAANGFLLRQFSDESFATAVHVIVDLDTGAYAVTSAGHPPALRWSRRTGEWEVDNSRGTALGVTRRPELHSSTGVLGPGDALLFCTDGVVESRTTTLDDGIAWLRRAARDAVATGFADAARRILRQVPRGDDDRAVLILSRTHAE
ncbi:PP2C family protein-serine/threonine phosphatase [Nocardioides sp. YIM 152315]|uniref:PP2C family protein-serine/threonine phosphatase n=1 Tax=Nocardioides sp. YIM 152315 TaxID=3031760 RepID=UPI0023DBDC82|nr:PP2C family protein-serine/threonine phosphatase [Nocardioides sp. YIM 152315]MDF1602414.1 PP2C family protein-serine/threonine phosphatase [Nocardioides sp. YIM 152315]